MIDSEQVKSNIARNLTEYRKAAGYTQLELADKLNYTDKAVSKWERAESIPDIVVLMQLAKLYEVSMDDIVSEKFHPKLGAGLKKFTRHKLFVPILSAALVWLVATTIFTFLFIFNISQDVLWVTFLYAVPCSLIVLLVFNAIWGNKIFSAVIVSLLSWSSLCVLVVSLLLFAGIGNAWWIFLIGIPFQVLVIFWYLMRMRRH